MSSFHFLYKFWFFSFVMIFIVSLVSASDEQPHHAVGYEAFFSEGVACYRLKDFHCAQQSFEQAAWVAQNDHLRGRAIFNLANSHFFLGNFQQASILYQDAGKWGIEQNKVERNKSFADAMFQAVRRQLKEIAETQRRAQWRADAKGVSINIDNILESNLYMSKPKMAQSLFQTLSESQVNQIFTSAVKKFYQASDDTSVDQRQQWIQSMDKKHSIDLVTLLNRLLPMELGLPAFVGKPYLRKGQRAW